MPATLVAPGWRCAPSEAHPLLVQVLLDAVACIGMHEEPLGSNQGPQVSTWLRLASATPGDPWCASFATALYQRIDPAPIPRLASAYKIYQWAKERGLLVPDGAPVLPGDICGLFHEDNPATLARENFRGHVGVVTADLGDAKIATVEGNVHSFVLGLVHLRADWQWFARPVRL